MDGSSKRKRKASLRSQIAALKKKENAELKRHQLVYPDCPTCNEQMLEAPIEQVHMTRGLQAFEYIWHCKDCFIESPDLEVETFTSAGQSSH